VIGETLKQYRIESLLGAGGMGEVYQAKDTKLGRSVALKVLPEAFARDPDRVSRFEREAKLLAALNHPNIAALYGMEEADNRHFLVMELVEGETLAERLQRGAMPVTETLRIALQIVEALEAAHEKGIIHRDLKPANVKLTREGKVKVLDFGLAKAMEPGNSPASGILSNSPTISMAATNAGIILGTAAYMSPEQANGLAADARSDLFSLGSVLYEMLTGRQPFQGKTLSEVLASVLVRDPDWSGFPPDLHPRIHELLRRCLEKDPKRRWHAAGDVRVEIEKLIADPTGVEAPPQSSAPLKPLWKRAIPVLTAAALSAILASVAVLSLRPSIPQPVVTRFSFALPQDQALNPFNVSVAVSPDGTKLVYATDDGLHLRQMAELEARLIPGTEGAGTPALFSPDGQWIGFWAFTDSTLKKVAITGGAPIPICKCAQPSGIRWEGDHLVWSDPGRGIVRVSENGGEPEVLVSIKPEDRAHGPQILDGGKAVLFTLAEGATGTPEQWDTAQIVVQPLPSGERKVILRGGSDARYLDSGHLLYAVGRNVSAIPFDLRKLETGGGPIVVLEGVMRPYSYVSGAANLSLSENGTLAYVPGDAAGFSRNALAFTDKSGKFEPLPLPPGPYQHPRLSPDGRQIAFQQIDGQRTDIWIYELQGGRAPRKLTFNGNSGIPVWSSDSRRVIFISGDSVYWQPADGASPAEPLTKMESGLVYLPESVFEKVLAFTPLRGVSGGISLLSLEGDRKTESFIDVPNTVQLHAAFSPNGRWLAYMSTEVKSQPQIFVRPYPKTGGMYQITTEGGVTPLWSADGSQLFYVYLGRIYAVDIRTEPTFSAGTPVDLPIRGAIFPVPGLRNYDITKDGRFLVVMPAGQDGANAASTTQIHVVQNWLEELKQRVPVR
jgi:serine/threonine-protein kinase